MPRNAYATRHIEAAYRSGLEEAVADQLKQAGIEAAYEEEKIPIHHSRYSP
jgi:hypothetical protein